MLLCNTRNGEVAGEWLDDFIWFQNYVRSHGVAWGENATPEAIRASCLPPPEKIFNTLNARLF